MPKVKKYRFNLPTRSKWKAHSHLEAMSKRNIGVMMMSLMRRISENHWIQSQMIL